MSNNIWLDCDPGETDIIAILLALYCTNIHLLGVSTTHGNASIENTKINAARCLHAFAAPEHIKVHGGVVAPLLRPERHGPEVYGHGGLHGGEGLPPANSDSVRARIASDNRPAIEVIAATISETWNGGTGAKVTIVATGPLTNIALFVSVYPHLFDAIERIVFMGGGIGFGNSSAVAEFNVMCDPEAAQIVLNAPVPKLMIPLNVSHKATTTSTVQAKLMSPTAAHDAPPGATSGGSQLRYMLSTVISAFHEGYLATFGLTDGPPLHDPLTVAYVSKPELFTGERYRVDVELSGTHSSGQTVVDVHGYKRVDDTWGRTGRNCEVATDVDVAAFNELFLDCVARCDEVSPLNLTQTRVMGYNMSSQYVNTRSV